MIAPDRLTMHRDLNSTNLIRDEQAEWTMRSHVWIESHQPSGEGCLSSGVSWSSVSVQWCIPLPNFYPFSQSTHAHNSCNCTYSTVLCLFPNLIGYKQLNMYPVPLLSKGFFLLYSIRFSWFEPKSSRGATYGRSVAEFLFMVSVHHSLDFRCLY